MGDNQTSELFPGRFLIEQELVDASCASPDLLILNQPITHFTAFSYLWKHSGYRVCADGGANRLFDVFQGDVKEQRGHYLPDIVHGDLDSLRHDVRDYYRDQGVLISRDSDQESTDFGKCMQKISSRVSSSSMRDVLVLGTLGGRVDQGLGLLHEMIREETKHPNLRLWLFSESSLSLIIKARETILRGLQASRVFTENVGLVPIYGPAVISTEGLEWDVKQWATRMGGQVSTSNHVKADRVRVETDVPILFTIEMASFNMS